MKNENIYIDLDKLDKLLKKKKMSRSQLSLRMGYGKDYITHTKDRSARASLVYAIAGMLDCKVEDFTIREEPKKEVPANDTKYGVEDIVKSNDIILRQNQAMKDTVAELEKKVAKLTTQITRMEAMLENVNSDTHSIRAVITGQHGLPVVSKKIDTIFRREK